MRNPLVGDGPDALRGAVGFLKMQKIHRVIGEGNFVLTHSEGLRDGKRYAFYDLFRVADGQIVEHWGSPRPRAQPMGRPLGLDTLCRVVVVGG